MIKRLYPFASLLSAAWLVIILALAAYDFQALFMQKRVQFDLMALLPESKTAAMKEVGQLMEEANFLGRIVIFVGHPQATTSQLAFEQLRQQVKQVSLPLQEQTSAFIAQGYKDFFTKLHPYRAGFLAENDRNQLLKGKGEGLSQSALAEIMAPFSVLGPVQIKSDPFFLYPRFITSLDSSTPLQRDEKGEAFIKFDGKTWYLFKAHLTEPIFSLKAQEELSEKLTPLLDHLQQTQGVEILKTGAIFYAAAGSKQANVEMTQIGLTSVIAIIMLLLITFKTVRPLFLAIVVMSSGFMGGMAACFFVFGSVHMLALVFGSSLVGVTVDYALHYFCASYKQTNTVSPNRFMVLESLMPALPLGVFSSVVGFILLIVVPFPGVHQMAIFAASGLICAFLSVCVWGPYFANPAEKKAPWLAQQMQMYLEKAVACAQQKNFRLVFSIGVIILFCAGATVLTFEDDIRRFQSLDTLLKSEEERIRSMTKFEISTNFLTITGSTLEEVLQSEEKIKPELDKLQANHDIAGYHSLATLTPSKKQQQENRQLVEENLYQKHWASFVQTLGFEGLLNPSALGLTAPYLTTFDTLPEGWKELIYYAENGKVVGRILLQGITNVPALEALVSKYETVDYINSSGEYSALFTSYRQIMMGLLGVVFCGILLVLAVFKGIKTAGSIVFPVGLSLLATVGIIGLSGIPFTLFHAMGLLLILCIGIDYALFLYGRNSSIRGTQERDFSLLANGLAAVTTILSFGLLSFSKTAAIHSFGLTVFIGILLCFCGTAAFFGKKR